MLRILGVDLGDRHVGLAVSDELRIAAHGLPTVHVRSMDEAVEQVIAAIAEYAVAQLVVGLPLNMDGSTGPRAEVTLGFCEKCRKELIRRGMDVSVDTFDERLTTMRARQALHEMGLEERKQKRHVDRISAVLLLQDYLQATGARRQ